jgi:hypothetical protein
MLTGSGGYLWGLILLIMIKVNELRVGNLVIYKQDNDELPVLKIDGDSKKVCLDLLLGLNMEVGEQDIDPVPLTPEWLERCGFKEGTNYLFGKHLKLGIHIDYTYIGTITSTSAAFVAPAQYVHQLQNLYFALTGEELQIKMP